MHLLIDGKGHIIHQYWIEDMIEALLGCSRARLQITEQTSLPVSIATLNRGESDDKEYFRCHISKLVMSSCTKMQPSVELNVTKVPK